MFNWMWKDYLKDQADQNYYYSAGNRSYNYVTSASQSYSTHTDILDRWKSTSLSFTYDEDDISAAVKAWIRSGDGIMTSKVCVPNTTESYELDMEEVEKLL